MSGSIGGSRIKKECVIPTYLKYVNEILKNFPGYTSSHITGSYNTGLKKDHGDIDLVVYIKGDDIKRIKKEFKKYLDSLDLPVFVSGKNVGKKSQMYGSIITCGYPIVGDENNYVQIDNVIVNSGESARFQKNFLDLDAAKQCLLIGLTRIIFPYVCYKLNLDIFDKLENISENQEYEFVLSTAGLSLRKVTLNDEMKELDRKEVWRTDDWNYVEWLLSDFDINKTYDELLFDVDKFTKKDQRSRNRIIGIMKSMINIGPGEIGTEKSNYKQNSIKLIENILK